MPSYQDNVKWLLRFAPFRSLSVSAAYVMPFFLEHGLSTSQIFLLQSIFSIAYLLWEIPSGMIADRFGRAFSMKLSVPIMAITAIMYGLSSEYWQFIVCEVVWAIANGMMSGIDTALLYDSLKADGREDDFTRQSQRIKSLGFVSIAVSVPLAIALVHFFGIGSTLIADGVITALGYYFVTKLVEAPRHVSETAERVHVLAATRELFTNRRARWLIALSTILSTATYFGFWLSTLYYVQLGIPVVLFGAILALRSLWKFWLSRRFHHNQVRRSMPAYAALAGLVYLAMATGQIWLVWVVLGHDMIQALADSPLTKRINEHFEAAHRATLNSVVNLIQRLIYTIVGPFVGLAVDKYGLSPSLVVIGIGCSALAFVALWRLRAQQLSPVAQLA